MANRGSECDIVGASQLFHWTINRAGMDWLTLPSPAIFFALFPEIFLMMFLTVFLIVFFILILFYCFGSYLLDWGIRWGILAHWFDWRFDWQFDWGANRHGQSGRSRCIAVCWSLQWFQWINTIWDFVWEFVLKFTCMDYVAEMCIQGLSK